MYDTCARLGYSILSLHLELRMPRHGPRLGVRLGGPTVLRLYGSVAIRLQGSTGGPILTGGEPSSYRSRLSYKELDSLL